jgi:hypothetical protein
VLCFFVVMTCFFVRSKEFENNQADYDYAVQMNSQSAQEVNGPWEYHVNRTVERKPNPVSCTRSRPTCWAGFT